MVQANAQQGWIDLHCHILPGLDDGPTALDQAVALVQALERLGFTTLHPTPHQYAGRWTPDRAQCGAAAEALRAALTEAGSRTVIADPAAENMWDELLAARHPDRAQPHYTGARAFLVEFPRDALPPQLADRLFELRLRGSLPIIAHVERWPELADDRGRLAELAGKAALLVNLGSLGGIGGWGARARARRLVLEGRVHALTSDTHGLADLRYCEAGLTWLQRRLGTAGARQFLIDGPQALLAGEIPEW
ncbi:MAG: hypothetical protein IPL40_03330 [Proteobacteria bacterium]|nr:hypothetical protein [Pseudomonadota bacterium]